MNGTNLLTGLSSLDRLTSGGRRGQVWAVSGPAEVGKTLFALGLARAVGLRAHLPVQWLSTREEPETLRASVLSAEARLPVQHLVADDLTEAERVRLAAAGSNIDQAEMTFARVSADRLHEAARTSAQEPGSLVVLDCLSDLGTEAVSELKRLASATGTWFVVVVPDLGLGRRAARQVVAAGGDVHVWIEGEDQFDPEERRAGEADLWVTRAGRTRKTVLTVAFQGHYSRFVDMTA